MSTNSIPTGLGYLVQGSSVLLQPGMKRYVLVPILTNVAVFIFLTITLLQYFTSLSEWFGDLLPDWSWLAAITAIIASILSVIVFCTILLIYGYSFNLITNLIAAPFYGLLAEKIEARLTGAEFPSESLSKMVIRTLARELVKLWYFMSRGFVVFLGLFILGFIPVANLLVPILALLWGAWVMTLQYVDYPADNNKMGFTQFRQELKRCKHSATGFGGSIMLGSMIPVVNIFVMPLAVAGGTLFWVNELSKNGNSPTLGQTVVIEHQ